MNESNDMISFEQRESSPNILSPHEDSGNNDKGRESNIGRISTASEGGGIIPSKIFKKIKLSTKSRTLLILRILLLCFGCIFIPMETILYAKLEKIESNYIVGYIDNVIGRQLRQSTFFYYISEGFIYVLTGKDSMLIFISMMYMLSHPFLALKLVMTTNLLYYIMTILRCLYQSKRPFWLEQATTDNILRFCPSNFANPSNHFFFISFFFLYTILSIRLLNKKTTAMVSFSTKLLFTISFLIIILSISFVLIINKLHFIYQLVFTLCLSLIIVCALLDFENSIHNLILKSLKNIFKTRKYKMKVFFLVLSLSVIAVLAYFFVIPENLNAVEENMGSNLAYCTKEDKEELGLLSTFKEIPYIYGILGAFWGASFTIEYDCGKWWNSQVKFLVIKVMVTLVFCAAYLVMFHYISHVMYELDFLVGCIKYFLFYYVVMGILPVGFNMLKLNDTQDEPKQAKNALFRATIFFDPMNNEAKRPLFPSDDTQDQIKDVVPEEDEERDKDKTEQYDFDQDPRHESTIYKKSLIAQDLKKHKENKLEFTLNQSHHNEEEEDRDR